MRVAGFILYIFVVSGCAGRQYAPDNIPNSCTVQSIYAAERLKSAGVKARVLNISPRRGQGHTVTAFWYQKKTFIYDCARGSGLVANGVEHDPLNIAKKWFQNADRAEWLPSESTL